MDARKEKVLESIVELYTKSAEPVGSHALCKKFAVSSATIRNDMAELEREGYIHQPHISAGRAPTDKGYRYYISHLKNRQAEEKEESRMELSLKRHFSPFSQYDALSRSVTKMLADISYNVAICRPKAEQGIYYSGMGNLFNQPECVAMDYIQEVGQIVNFINEHAEELASQAAEGTTQIFIGRDNPFFAYDACSLILTGYTNPYGEQSFIGVLGPKRMPYWRIIPAIEYMGQLLNNYSNEEK